MPISERETEQVYRDAWWLPIPPGCPKCGYNLTGLPANVCPECGTPFDWMTVGRTAHALRLRMFRSRYANRDARAGAYFAAGTMPVVAIVNGLEWVGLPAWIAGVMNICALAMVLLCLVLTAQVFLAARMPAHMRDRMPEPPNLLLGFGALGLDVLLLIVTLLFWML